MKLLLRNNATSMQWCLSWYWREWDWYCSPPLCISWHPCPQDVEFTGSEYWKKNASTNRAKRIKTITWHTKSLANLLKLYLQCGDKEASTFTGRWEKAVVSEGQSKNVGHLIKARSKREHRQLSSVEQQWRFTDHLEQLTFFSVFLFRTFFCFVTSPWTHGLHAIYGYFSTWLNLYETTWTSSHNRQTDLSWVTTVVKEWEK